MPLRPGFFDSTPITIRRRGSEFNMSAPKLAVTRRRLINIVVVAIVATAVIYYLVAYVIVPAMWSRYARRHPALEDVPGVTHTAAGTVADPLNVALIGSQEQLVEIMGAAKWHKADPLGLKSDLEIAEASVLDRPYAAAPVSSEFLFGRKEDLAFEQAVGDNPRERHHVRFWKCDQLDDQGRPLWIGSAIFDKSVGLSRTTGQITHHTAADIDQERDKLFADLRQTGRLTVVTTVPDFHKVREGKNGEGDPWHTDGSLWVGVIDQNKK